MQHQKLFLPMCMGKDDDESRLTRDSFTMHTHHVKHKTFGTTTLCIIEVPVTFSCQLLHENINFFFIFFKGRCTTPVCMHGAHTGSETRLLFLTITSDYASPGFDTWHIGGFGIFCHFGNFLVIFLAHFDPCTICDNSLQ